MHRRQISSFLLGLCILSSNGCGGQLYDVATRPISSPTERPTNTANGFNVSAVALDGDQALEQFDTNLPLAGVIAVDVVLANRTSSAIDAGTLRFELRAGSGNALKSLTPKAALKRVMKYYGNGFYRLDARQRTIESYEATALPLVSLISPGEERRGILFFETLYNTANLTGLALSVVGVNSRIAPINIKLN
ncbi:MAG TPA: hypothetical protein PLD20_03375 [Blastocatellia bacterium]|nr:hypothetical protein [Blastocatellia bacterium]HMV82028.1 hypothetical protein [Blastocatellia bacterium]HMX24030.1 hypothetical protein [Blastocatellia bacterium]HMY73952.1 hypothetical protein [Blastocatellia bacterium]HMZ16943.1 hypothetical protein [Blastocatellia bacterium]